MLFQVNNKNVQVAPKKAWLLDQFEDGLVFLKSVEREKCFIEYIPAENAWNPIRAEGFMEAPEIFRVLGKRKP